MTKLKCQNPKGHTFQDHLVGCFGPKDPTHTGKPLRHHEGVATVASQRTRIYYMNTVTQEGRPNPEKHKAALEQIHRILGRPCPSNKCEGCRYEMEQALEIARRALQLPKARVKTSERSKP